MWDTLGPWKLSFYKDCLQFSDNKVEPLYKGHLYVAGKVSSVIIKEISCYEIKNMCKNIISI